MSIEQGVSANAPRPAQTASGPGSARQQAGAASPGGFASLLLSLGGDGEPLTAETGLKPGEQEDAARVSAKDVAEATVSAELASPLPDAPAAVAPGAMLPSAAHASGGRSSSASQLLLTQAGAVSGDALPPAQAASSEQSASDVQPLLKQAGLLQRMSQQRAFAAELAEERQQLRQPEETGTPLAGWRASDGIPPNGVLPTLLAGAGLAESGWRPQERRSERGQVQGAGAAELGAAAGVGRAEGIRLDVPAVAPDSGLTTQMRVAEQVSYWVARGAQSVEMEVEGIDERPIQVSISLQGQEARIEFRADQVQTRQVLQDATPQLREMLERQGLMLADVSVGTSGGGDGRGQPGRERPGARQAQVVLPELSVASTVARGPLPSGRSVDLFV
jgi:flagellar hook-length control protein FliK